MKNLPITCIMIASMRRYCKLSPNTRQVAYQASANLWFLSTCSMKPLGCKYGCNASLSQGNPKH